MTNWYDDSKDYYNCPLLQTLSYCLVEWHGLTLHPVLDTIYWLHSVAQYNSPGTDWLIILRIVVLCPSYVWCNLVFLLCPCREEDLYYDEIALIAIALATVLMTVIFLIIATFSSHKMSRYAFSSSKKNTFGYCLSVTVSMVNSDEVFL